MAEPAISPGCDCPEPDRVVQRLPAEELAELRHTAPVWWSKQPRGTGGFDDEGYWVVTRHADVLEVSRHSEIYSSEAQTALIRYAQPVTEESLQLSRLILLPGFIPRAVASLRQALTARAAQIVRDAVEHGTGDFVTDVACELPLQAIAELLGIPQEDRRKIFDWSNQMSAPRIRTMRRTRGPLAPSSSATACSWPSSASSAPATTSLPRWSTPGWMGTSWPRTSSATS